MIENLTCVQPLFLKSSSRIFIFFSFLLILKSKCFVCNISRPISLRKSICASNVAYADSLLSLTRLLCIEQGISTQIYPFSITSAERIKPI